MRTAQSAAELHTELEAAFAAPGPVVVEAVVDGRDYDDVVLKSDRP